MGARFSSSVRSLTQPEDDGADRTLRRSATVTDGIAISDGGRG